MPSFDRPFFERNFPKTQSTGRRMLRLSRRFALCLMLAGGVVVGGLVVGGCASGGGAFDSRPVLRVGISPDYPPVIFENEGEVVGIEADLAQMVGETLGRRIEFVRYPLPELLDALERRDVDVVMSGLSVTADRSDRIAFTEPYMEVGQLTLIRSRDIARFGRIQGLRRSGARVGYQYGTSGERYVATSLPRSESFGFDNIEEGLRSLRADRIDYFIHDAPTIWRLAGDIEQRDLHGLYRPLTKEELAWAVRRDDVQLLGLLDGSLAHWKREGLIEPIVQHWIPVRVTLR